MHLGQKRLFFLDAVPYFFLKVLALSNMQLITGGNFLYRKWKWHPLFGPNERSDKRNNVKILFLHCKCPIICKYGEFCYDKTIIFQQDTNNWDTIAHPLWRDMGCQLWVLSLACAIVVIPEPHYLVLYLIILQLNLSAASQICIVTLINIYLGGTEQHISGDNLSAGLGQNLSYRYAYIWSVF